MPLASRQVGLLFFGTGLMIEDFQSDGIESLDSEEDPRQLIAAGPQQPEGPDAPLGFILFSRVQHHLALVPRLLLLASLESATFMSFFFSHE